MISQNKHPQHLCFFISDCELHEAYKTIRGERPLFISEILLPDNDRLSESEIASVEKILAGDDN